MGLVVQATRTAPDATMNLLRLLERLPWVRPRTRISDPPSTDADADTSTHPSFDRLDVQEAVIHHLEWCVLFNEHMAVPPSALPGMEPLPDAEHSALGRWLTHMARRPVGRHPQFEALQQEHQRLHALAKQAMDYARLQRMDRASQLLNTEFERSRATVLQLLRSMQN